MLMAYNLATAATTDGAQTGFVLPRKGINRTGSLYIWGVFDGATVTVEVAPTAALYDAGTYITVQDGEFTQADGVLITGSTYGIARDLAVNGYAIRVKLASSGASTSINAHFS